MDDARFDDLIRSLPAAQSRRTMARALIGLVFGGTLAPLLGIVETDAKKGQGGGKKKGKGKGKRKSGGSNTNPPPPAPPPPPPGCVPNCDGKNCGDPDGCEGLCTVQQGCGAAQTCVNAVCTGGCTQCPTCAGDKVCNESTGGFCTCPADKPVQCEFNSSRCSANPTTDSTRCGLNCYDCEVSYAPGYRCCNGQCVNGCGPNTSGSCQQHPCGPNCEPCTGGKVCCNLGSGTSSQCVDPVGVQGYCPTP